MTQRADAAWTALVAAASAPYARAGRFAHRFARGKLRWDPVFRHLIEAGLIAPRSRVLDIGCGQGLLASLIAAAGAASRRGDWSAGWAAAPLDARVSGIELMPREVARGRLALGAGAELVCADLRATAFPPADAVVMLDVLHYIEHGEQDEVLERVRTALQDGGRLILRVGDASARFGFAASQWVDRVVMRMRGRGNRPPTGRTQAEWRARLLKLGFEVATESMARGTPFANVLFVATLPAKSGAAARALAAARANAEAAAPRANAEAARETVQP